jgi:hypothetical protein
MKVYSATIVGGDGAPYNLRFLLDPAEVQGLLRAGIIGEVSEVVGMQDMVDSLIAGLESMKKPASSP